MPTNEELGRENRQLRERLTKLSEASLRISESLDLDTVLREVAGSARALCGAGVGVITTVDDSGELQDLVISGFSPDERERFLALPYGPELWKYLSALRGPRRLSNLGAHVDAVGFPDDETLSRSFLGTPIRHRGAQVGSFFLGDKEGGREFTSEDEEVLALFAGQAGAAIANARNYRAVERARTDLETLVDTSPVGVAVLDSRSGKAVSVNREARRIVRGLCLPGQPEEDLLEVLRVRRADGSEFELGRSPLSEVLREAGTVRVEEMILEAPDGRTVNTLINATPIRSEQGTVEAVVVTMQDLTPLEELEVLRAEFLGMVSHELQAPLSSIWGSAATALEAASGLRPAETTQFFRIIREQAEHMRELIGDLLDAAHMEAGRLSVVPEPATLAIVVDQARNLYLSGGGRNPVMIDLPPDLPRVLVDQQRIMQVLGNLLANAARHSPQLSPVRVAAARSGDHVAVSVVDEGPGIPAERLPHLFRKFARSARQAQGGGVRAGLGLAICKGLVEAHGGRIWAESAGTGPGARFTFTIPAVDEAGLRGAASPAGSADGPRAAAAAVPHILVVDDDPKTLLYVRGTLEDAGHRVIVTGDPDDVPLLLETYRPDLVLLDLLLPGTDGIVLMQCLPALADRPVIFMSAYGRDETIARALEVGAADYVVKPFSSTELIARVEVALRKRAGPDKPYRMGDLAIHHGERRVSLAGRPVQLTPTEYDLLNALAVNAGRVSTLDYLLRRVWRSRRGGSPRIVRVYVKRLRDKLGDDPKNPTYIFTEPRAGYRMPRPDDG